MNITLVGAGMGTPETLTLAANETLRRAEVVIGPARLFSCTPEDCAAKRHALSLPEKIAALVSAHPEWREVCILLGGDVGFYSGARQLLQLLDSHQPTLIPGIATPLFLAARLRRPWQDFRLVSAHGITCDVLAETLNHPAVLFLTGGETTPVHIAAALYAAGLSDAMMTVGENLGSPEERILSGPAGEIKDKPPFASPSVVLVENRKTFSRDIRSPGIPDGDFLRGAVPMTKREVRTAALSLMRIRENETVFDIGAGTGSVAVEAALLARRGRVYAVENNPQALGLIESNREKFGVYNLIPVPGTAPEVLETLPPPASVFIGGSKGALPAIVEALLRRNPDVRLVASAIALETLSAALEAMDACGVRDIEVTQIAVSRAVPRGNHRMLEARNPVFLVSGGGD